MASYQIEGSVVSTARATDSYEGETAKAGYGYITSTLHRTRRGRWWLERVCDWTEDGRNLDQAEWVSPEEAARFLLHEIEMSPEEIVAKHPDLQEAVEQVAE